MGVLQVEATIAAASHEHEGHLVGAGTRGVARVRIVLRAQVGFGRRGRRHGRVDDVGQRRADRIAAHRDLVLGERVVDVEHEGLVAAVIGTHTEPIEGVRGVAAGRDVGAAGIHAGNPLGGADVTQQCVLDDLHPVLVRLAHGAVVDHLGHGHQHHGQDAQNDQHQRELDDCETGAASECVGHWTPPNRLTML